MMRMPVLRSHLLVAMSAAAFAAWMPPTQARVIRIVIDQTLNNLPPTGVQTVA